MRDRKRGGRERRLGEGTGRTGGREGKLVRLGKIK